MLLKVLIFVATLILQAGWLAAQSFNINKVERVAGTIVLHYDLIDTVSLRTYTINMYSSADHFVSPLREISGDAGLEVRPGSRRKIIWNAREELGSAFEGDVRLEIRGKVYVPFVKLDGFDDYKTFRRRKNYKITWTGGRGNNVLNFDLYRGDKKITAYPNIANVGYCNLRFDDVKPGKNYVLKVSDSKNKDDVVYSAPFQIRRKVPLLLKLVPVGGAAYVIYALTSVVGGEEDIIDPPLPGG